MGDQRLHRRFRTVSELRTQFLCEYRLHLEQIHGNTESEWSERGTVLHQQAAEFQYQGRDRNFGAQILVIVCIVLLGLLWILG